MKRLERRAFMKAAGIAVALPALESMAPDAYGRVADTSPPKRMIVMCTTLGLHAQSFFPGKPGANYAVTPYLRSLEDHRDQFTLFSGLSHPDQAGANGHSGEMTWLTAAPNPGLGGFRNTISLDQLVREKLGYVTRFPSLVLSTAGGGSQSYTRSGVMVPAEHRPSKLFEKLFLQGKPHEIERQRRSLDDGRSILDSLPSQIKQLSRRVSAADRKRLREYYESIRATEKQFSKANEWLDKPKPKVDIPVPQDVANEADTIGRLKLLLELLPHIVATDSSRMISIVVHGRNDVPPIDGVSVDHHNLSHHGQDETKIDQLRKIEQPQMDLLGKFIGGLAEQKEGAGSLLDNTMLMFGSNLGNANSHDWRNLPILLAGGGFEHGRHIVHNKEDNTPLSNLYVSMLQQMGLGIERFGSSTRKLDW